VEVDKGRRKRTADVAEKLGVGLLLGTLVQGIFARELTPWMLGIGGIVLAISLGLTLLAVYLSWEE
jgi:hypothetical protein